MCSSQHFQTVRQAMKLGNMSGDCGFWKVQLDARGLGDILTSLIVLGRVLFPMGFIRRLMHYLWVFILSWFVVSIFLLAFALLRLLIFSSSISAFRAVIVGAVWSTKMPLASIPAILHLLDGD